MREIGICALGILAFVLSSPPSVSQDGQQARAQERRFIWAWGVTTGQGVQARVELSRAVVTVNGEIVWLGDESEALMHGDLENAVREMETNSQRMRNGNLRKRLAALDDAERAVMKARRSLGPREEARAGKAEQHPGAVGVMVPVSGDGPILNVRWLFYGARGPAQTPMAESYNAFTWAVTRVRQAPEAQDAREALDEVEKSILALRCLFWETKASKRD